MQFPIPTKYRPALRRFWTGLRPIVRRNSVITPANPGSADSARGRFGKPKPQMQMKRRDERSRLLLWIELISDGLLGLGTPRPPPPWEPPPNCGRRALGSIKRSDRDRRLALLKLQDPTLQSRWRVRRRQGVEFRREVTGSPLRTDPV